MKELLGKIPKGMRIRITQTYLECKEGGSNKFYRTLVLNANKNPEHGHLTINWGKIGTHGQNSKYDGHTVEQCFQNARSKAESKLKKGYEKAIPNAPTRRAGLVGELNSHTFGEDELKDKEAISILIDTYGGEDSLRQALNTIGAFDASVVDDPAEVERLRFLEEEIARKEAQRLKAIEDERDQAYSRTWGEWA